MSVDVLQVAVIGLGMGEQHARAYLRDGRCQLRWVWDFDEGRMDHVLKELGRGAKAQSFGDIVRDGELDIVSVASYDDDHFEQVVPLLDAGKHVFVEKPLCRSMEELQQIRDAWRSSRGVHLESNLVLRSAPLYLWLRGLIQSGELGDVYAFDGEYLYGRLHKITEGWRKNVTGYSVMQGGGVHMVDLMLWLTGQRPTLVAAAANRISTAGSAFQYNDYMASTYQFGSGLVGRITANFACVHRHQHVVRVFGTKGTFIYDDEGARMHTTRDPDQPSQKILLAALPETGGDLIPGFIDGILGSKDTTADTQHEFDVVSACLAADLAVTKAATVTVHYI